MVVGLEPYREPSITRSGLCSHKGDDKSPARMGLRSQIPWHDGRVIKPYGDDLRSHRYALEVVTDLIASAPIR